MATDGPTMILGQETLAWALGLAIGFPMAMVVLGEVILRLRRAERPLAQTLGQIRTLVLPLAAAYVLVVHVIGVRRDEILSRGVLTALWIAILHTALAFVDDVVFGSAEPGSWRARVPRLFIDLSRGILVLIGAGVIYQAVWGESLERFVAALGVGSLVLGLALQDPLGNVFAGVMLTFERPISVGDWIGIDTVVGRVAEINWRAVHLETSTLELVIVPNATLAKGRFSNFTRSGRSHVESLLFGFAHEDAPNRVKRLLIETASSAPGVLATPPPTAATVEFTATTVVYRLSFAVADFARSASARDEIVTRVWYASRRAGLTIPAPAPARPPADPAGRLAEFPRFGVRDPAALAEVAPRLIVRRYGRGEEVVAAGGRLDGLHLVLSGEASLSAVDASGTLREVGHAARGEFFGEGPALSGEPSDLTVRAVDDLEVMVLDGPALQSILDRTPRLARDIGAVMDARRRAAKASRLGEATNGNGRP